MKPFKIRRGTETYYRVDLPAEADGGQRKSVVAKTRKAALAKAEEQLRRRSDGLVEDAGGTTLAAFLSEFLEYYAVDGGVAPSTLEDYRYHVTSHIIPTLGTSTLRQLDPRRIDGFLRKLAEKGLSPRTSHYSYAVLRRALQFAVDWKYIPANPASSRLRAAKRRAPVELSKIQYLTESQSQAFIQAASKDRLEALYVLAITTGMRQGEMLGLRWGDVDFVGRKLTISRALHRTRRPKAEGDPDQEWFTMRAPKTRGSRRTIELPLVTIEALERHRRAQQADPSVASDLMTRDSIARDLVFATRSGRPLDTSNVLHHFQRLLKNAGLPQIRFYDLRHTHASLLIAQGVHPKKIAERLGHASIKLTMDTYGHLFDGSDRESAERMQKLFGEALKAPSHEPGKVVSLDSHRRRALRAAATGLHSIPYRQFANLSADKIADKT